MAGRTVSAYVSHDIAESVALEAMREGRSSGQVAALALRFFMALPRDARACTRSRSTTWARRTSGARRSTKWRER